VKESLVLGVEGALLRDDIETAEEFLAMIDSLPAARRTRFLQAHSHRLRAQLAERRGDSHLVQPAFEAAAGRFREVSLPFWLAVTLLQESEWLHAHHRGSEAVALLTESRGIFQRLAATPWLERAEKLPSIEPSSGGKPDLELASDRH